MHGEIAREIWDTVCYYLRCPGGPVGLGNHFAMFEDSDPKTGGNIKASRMFPVVSYLFVPWLSLVCFRMDFVANRISLNVWLEFRSLEKP